MGLIYLYPSHSVPLRLILPTSSSLISTFLLCFAFQHNPITFQIFSRLLFILYLEFSFEFPPKCFLKTTFPSLFSLLSFHHPRAGHPQACTIIVLRQIALTLQSVRFSVVIDEKTGLISVPDDRLTWKWIPSVSFTFYQT